MRIVVSPKYLRAAVNRTLPNKDSVVEIRAGIDCTVSGFGTEASSKFRTSETIPWAQSVDSGSVFVNARDLLHALRALDKHADTMIEGSDQDGVQVSQGAIVFTFPCVAAPFERVEHFTGEEVAEAAILFRGSDVSGFRSTLDSAMGFTSNDELRHALMGVFFTVSADGERSLVATDTHRLCVLPVPAGEGDFAGAFPVVKSGFEERGVHLPFPFARRLQKVLTSYGPKSILVIRYARGCVDAEVIGPNGEVFVVTAIVDGDFPHWLRVIPSEGDRSRRVIATLDEGAIANACYHLDKFATVTRKAFARVLLWNDAGDSLHIEGIDNAGSMALTVRSTPSPGSLAVVAVNPDYLSSCLLAASGACSGPVTIDTGRTLDPLTLRGAGGVVVLMPMQLPDSTRAPLTDINGVVREWTLSGYSRPIDTLAAEIIPELAPVPDIPDAQEVALMA